MRISTNALALLVFGSANGVTAEPNERDPWARPFASNSIWNMPIGDAARYVPAGFEKAATIDLDEEMLYRVGADAPEQPVFAPKSWEQRAGGTQRLGSLRIDDALVVPDARKFYTPNRCAAFLMPDGHTVRNVGPLCRPEKGGPVFGYLFPDTDLYGDGIAGSHGASRMSALGGSIRVGELTSTEPIRHAIKACIWCQKYAFFSDERRGFRWPASGADGYANAKSYAGKNKALTIGSLLALPPQVKMDELGLKTPIGKKLFAVLRDYGLYVVDDAAWDAIYLCAEHGVGDEIGARAGLKINEGALKEDVNTLFEHLAVVDNNDPKSVGGGGQPRVPMAPELPKAPADNRAPFLVRNPSMTDGKERPDHWTDQYIYSGKIEVNRDTTTFASKEAALRLNSVGGEAKAQVMQFHDGAPGLKFHLSGKIKAAGKASALLGVQSYTENWQGIEFQAIGKALAGLDWQAVGGNVTLPEKAKHFAILLMIEGDGSAWLDDVDVKPFDEQAPKPKPAGPPKPANAWSAGEGFYPDYPQAWRAFHNGFVEKAKKGGIEIVFFGDSLTQGWPAEIWKKHFEPLKAANFGVGGDGTPQILWRIENGELDGIAPKAVVLMVGINNLWPGFSAEDTAKGIEAVVTAIRKKQPQAKVLLLGILPIWERTDDVRDYIKKVNQRIAQLDDGKNLKFLDLGDKMLEADGSRKKDFYSPDRLHIQEPAYRVLLEAIEPVLKDWAGK